MTRKNAEQQPDSQAPILRAMGDFFDMMEEAFEEKVGRILHLGEEAELGGENKEGTELNVPNNNTGGDSPGLEDGSDSSQVTDIGK